MAIVISGRDNSNLEQFALLFSKHSVALKVLTEEYCFPQVDSLKDDEIKAHIFELLLERVDLLLQDSKSFNSWYFGLGEQVTDENSVDNSVKA